MLQANTVVEQLVKGRILYFLLIFHFDLKHFALVHVCVANHVLRQVDRCDGVVHFQDLRQNEKVLAVETLLSEVELDQSVEFDLAHRDLPPVHTHCLKVVLVDKLCEVLEAEPIEDLLLVGALLLDCAEVYLLGCASVFVEGLVRQERMAQDLTH